MNIAVKMVFISCPKVDQIDNGFAPNNTFAWFVRAIIISLRTGEHDEQPLSRTSFFPSFWGLL